MPKWHVPPAMGTGRPLLRTPQAQSAIFSSPHHFHTSLPCRAEGKFHDPTSPDPIARPSSQADRRTGNDSTQPQNLIRRFTAPAGHSSNRVPTSGIDARSLAASPPAPDAPRFTIRRHAVGPRPSDEPGQLDQRPKTDTRRPTPIPNNTPGPRFSRVAFGSDRNRYDENPSAISGSFSSSRGPPRAGGTASRDPRGANRAPTSRRRGRGRSDDSDGGAGDANASENRAKDKRAREAMDAYRQEREAMLAPKPVAYNPTPLTGREDFAGAGPPAVNSVWGMKEILAERMEQVRWYMEGKEYIEGRDSWMNARQKRDVLNVVETLKTGEKGREELLTRLFSGEYGVQHPALRSGGVGGVGGKQDNDALVQVGRLTTANESYEVGDEKGVMEKVRSLVLAGTPMKLGGAKRQNVKA